MQMTLNTQKPCCLYRSHGFHPVDLAIEFNVSIQESNLAHAIEGQKLLCWLRIDSKGADRYCRRTSWDGLRSHRPQLSVPLLCPRLFGTEFLNKCEANFHSSYCEILSLSWGKMTEGDWLPLQNKQKNFHICTAQLLLYKACHVS